MHFFEVFGAVRPQSYKIAQKSIYDTFNSYSLH